MFNELLATKSFIIGVHAFGIICLFLSILMSVRFARLSANAFKNKDDNTYTLFLFTAAWICLASWLSVALQEQKLLF